MIEIDAETCKDVEQASALEWLETNGIGGYAMGTVSGAHTRRYHGTLVAAAKPPLGRAVILSKLEESISIDGISVDLSTNRYPGTFHPRGYELIEKFRIDPFPTWTYRINDLEIERSLFIPHGLNATVIKWTVSHPCILELLPLIAFRDHHHLRRESAEVRFGTECEARGLVITCSESSTPLILQGGFAVEPTGNWYRNLEYAVEQERGFDFHEDLYQPCRLLIDVEGEASIIAATEPVDTDTTDLYAAEIKRRARLVAGAKTKADDQKSLTLAADQFIVRRGDGKTVLAGYPWFSDWGRDTMIALPGLTLATGRLETAREILVEFSKHISQGMIPNRFPDEGDTPDYNTVDATLWYIEAVRAYCQKAGTIELARYLYDKLVDVVGWHINGTRHGIKLDADGMLRAGEEGTQLTWMDAKIGDRVITPRIGNPVEIQALWYNALRTMSNFAGEIGDRSNSSKYDELADKTRFNFEPIFWNEAEQCLYDVVNDDGNDAAIRPNQIFAVSLHHQLAKGDLARAIVDKVEKELLTPVGLRTLSKSDPQYVGIYEGSPEKRDSSYHQGTVWAWLIGPFADAYHRVHAGEREVGAKVAAMTDGLVQHMRSAGGLGQISEIFDGDHPHTPRGCPAQAWSVAEVLRTLSS